MPVMIWLADVVARPELTLKDGEDPKPVELYQGLEVEVSDKDPYVIRAIARELAKWKADPAHTTPEGEPSEPLQQLPEENEEAV